MVTLTRRSPHDFADPLWTVMSEQGPAHATTDPARSPLPAYLKRLRATGRAEGADALEKRHLNPPF
jgi:hypothetical protein